MAARVQTESAQRTSATVTELLRKQPFFGSLALRLPLRADPSRETLASDGHEIRYSPRWIADTDAHVIETAMARVVMACALKHHTRRGERDPERWQQASQLVTHALVRDAGFALPPEAEAWDGLSVEQAYDRLPEPQDGDPGDDGNAPPGGGSDAGAAGPSSPGDDDGESDSSSDSPADGDDEDGDAQDGDGQGDGSDTPASHDPSGTGEIMDAGARCGGNGEADESPVDVIAEEQAWDEAMHQALNLAKAEGKAPGGVEETVKGAHASMLDWRALLRRYMSDAARRDYSWSLPNRRFIDAGLYLPSIRSEGIDAIAVIVDTSGSLPRQPLPSSGPSCARSRPRSSRSASSSSRSTRRYRTRPNTPPTTCPTRSRSGAGAAPTSGRDSPGSTSRASGRGYVCISRTWSAPATPRPSLISR